MCDGLSEQGRVCLSMNDCVSECSIGAVKQIVGEGHIPIKSTTKTTLMNKIEVGMRTSES